MEILAEIGHALWIAFAMFWEILWPLILGFGLSGVVQAVVSKGEMVAIVAVLFRLFLSRKVVKQAKEQADKGIKGAMEGHAEMDMSVEGRSFWQRISSSYQGPKYPQSLQSRSTLSGKTPWILV